MYLFTAENIEDITSRLFCETLSPVLLYLWAIYGPTCRFSDGLPIDDFVFLKRNVSGLVFQLSGKVKDHNFKYHNTEKSVNDEDFWDGLNLPDSGNTEEKTGNTARNENKPKKAKKIHWTDLTVTVPADASHPFWKSGSYSYCWDHTNEQIDTCKFSVRKCGGTRTDANWRATRLAMEFIQCVRDRTVPVFPSKPNPTVHPCRVLELGRQLHNLFLAHPESFEDFSADDDFWKMAEGQVKRMTEGEDSEIGLLLNYYLVPHLLAF